MSNRHDAASRATGESREFNLHFLRRMYNEEGVGRGVAGKKNRYDLHPTIRHLTYWTLGKTVPVGRGGYGSPVIELAIRLLLVLVGRMKPTDVVDEILLSVNDRGSFVIRLRELADTIEARL